LQAISIVTNRYAEQLRNKIGNQITILGENGISIEALEKNSSNYNVFVLQVIDNPLSQYTFIYYIANMLAELIINDLEGVLLKKLINENCQCFLPDEKESIWKNIQQYMQKKSGGLVENKTKEVFQLILNYLEDNNIFNIEGFLRFRLNNYYRNLENNVTKCVENFVMEKEYKEFIRLLKYFVEMQEPRVDEVHVIWNINNTFQVLDDKGQTINNDLLEDFALDLFDEGIDQGDLLVSTLITISPLRIVLHYKEKIEIIETIENIFTTRVSLCTGCHICGLPEKKEKCNFSELVSTSVNYTGGKEKN